MKTAIVFESMFGNTHHIADAIAKGLAGTGEVTVVNVNEVTSLPADLDLLIVGGPTHVHGMSRPATRAEAEAWAHDPSKSLTLEPDAPGTGVREWLHQLTSVPPRVAAFDTRADIAEMLSGAASHGIEHQLLELGGMRAVKAQSFVVAGNSPVSPGELKRAKAWGASIAALHLV
jgi:menaquinone-dependent protoporphyrinogen IX oxidase